MSTSYDFRFTIEELCEERVMVKYEVQSSKYEVQSARYEVGVQFTIYEKYEVQSTKYEVGGTKYEVRSDD